MILPTLGSVVLLDDNIHEALPIIKAFSKRGVSLTYYQGIIPDELPELPNTLACMDCSNNKIGQLSNLPKSLVAMNCASNNIVELPYIYNTNLQAYKYDEDMPDTPNNYDYDEDNCYIYNDDDKRFNAYDQTEVIAEVISERLTDITNFFDNVKDKLSAKETQKIQQLINEIEEQQVKYKEYQKKVKLMMYNKRHMVNI